MCTTCERKTKDSNWTQNKCHIPASGADIGDASLQLPSLRQEYVEEFATKADLIDACMASAHIPFFLDGKPGTPHIRSHYIHTAHEH